MLSCPESLGGLALLLIRALELPSWRHSSEIAGRSYRWRWNVALLAQGMQRERSEAQIDASIPFTSGEPHPLVASCGSVVP
jgi:hypothetical protein